MGNINYSLEPRSDIAFIDIKSFYASVECVNRGLHPLNTSLCVMSKSDNSNGLILASSPLFKKVFGKNNVGRSSELPFDIDTRKFNYEKAKKNKIELTKENIRFIEMWAKNTFIVQPRMGLYIEENLKIQKILQKFAEKDEIYPYSIDEGFVDLTLSLDYFIREKALSRKEKLDILSANIQNEIWRATGVFSTVGMSNANPLLAKLALDNEAKKNTNMRANWSYEDVESKVWNIKNLTDFWGIGKRIAKRLDKLYIKSIKELANSNPDMLKKEFGIMGLQLWFHANGVDESKVTKKYNPQSKGIGNSQVLPRDYLKKKEIEIVLQEMVDQVCVRLRKINKMAGSIGLYIGFSYKEERRPINASMKIKITNSTRELRKYFLELFNRKYAGGIVRNIGVRLEKLAENSFIEYTIFDDIEVLQKNKNLDMAIDKIRERYGYMAIQNATFLLEGSRVRERSKLIGGHRGGLDGIL